MPLDEPLSDAEFDELDQFLLSDQCADDAMTMDTLHGFLTALAIGPVEVPMAEWLPHIWGDPKTPPQFQSNRESKKITGLIGRFMNEIMITFEAAPKEFDPLFCEVEAEGGALLDGEPWARGFWEGIALRKQAWEPAWASEIAPLLRPIYLLGADEVEEEELALVETLEQRHQLTLEMEAAIPAIHHYWQASRSAAIQPVRREEPKTGRNDPCPCGSGKKFKKCCGESETD